MSTQVAYTHTHTHIHPALPHAKHTSLCAFADGDVWCSPHALCVVPSDMSHATALARARVRFHWPRLMFLVFVLCRRYTRLRYGVVRLQAHVRGWRGRERAWQRQQTLAATRVQTAWRGFVVRTVYAHILWACVGCVTGVVLVVHCAVDVTCRSVPGTAPTLEQPSPCSASHARHQRAASCCG